MKRYMKYILTLILFVLIFSPIQSLAMGHGFIDISINKETMSVRKTPLSLEGQKVELDSPAFIYIDRTLVPLRFISETYGAEVGWDHDTQTVSINHNSDNINLTINSSKANVNGEIVTLDKSSTPKLVSFGGENAVTMVPLTFLSQYLDFNALWDENTKIVDITNGKSSSEDIAIDDVIVKPIENEPKNIIKSIKETNVNGQQIIHIEGTFKTSKSIMNLGNSNTVVLDILDSKLDPNLETNLNYNSNNISSIELSQFISTGDNGAKDHIVRVQCSINSKDDLDPIELIEDGNNIILKEKKVHKEDIKFSKTGDVLKIENLINPKNSISYNSSSRVLNISVPKENNLKTGSHRINDNLIGEIDIEEGKSFYDIRINMRDPITYNLLSQDLNSLSIKISKAPSTSKSDRLIVLDPGHGGRDGGAKPRDVAEKDVTLPLSLKLENVLRSRGYNVHMTRTTDVYIDRFERAKIANGVFPDVFISIHCNSVANNTTANGIETYYYGHGVDPELREERKKLATSIQKSLINKTGAVNRGVKTNSFTVIKNTNMPSILVETGFLTHTIEGDLLNTNAYQDKLAEAMADGLDNYFNSL